MRFCFVTAASGNRFMVELVEALHQAALAVGHDSSLAADGFPEDPSIDAYVVVPHELHATVDPSLYPSQEQCARTIALCTENPGSEWFAGLLHLIPHFAACAAINRGSAAELERRGINCAHLQLGYTPEWDAWRGEDTPRPIDVVYLGSTDAHRDRTVASFGRWLGDRESRLLRPPEAPKPQGRADYVCGPDKHSLLRSSKVLVNLHRGGTVNFEWMRYLEAAANGCVVVSEPSVDSGPLLAGEHLVVAAAQSIPLVVDGLLSDPQELEGIRSRAYAFAREQLPMEAAVEVLADLGAGLPRPPAARRPGVRTTLPDPPRADPRAQPPASEAAQRAELRELVLEARQLRRELAEERHRARTGREAQIEEVLTTPAYAPARPLVSVTVTLHNYERQVLDALDSVAATEFRDLEVLVLDDASTDGSLAAASDFLERHSWLPGRVMRHPVNRGLGRSRNALVEQARGRYVFVLDADNGVYPTAIARLVGALEDDPSAAFAYPMIAALDASGAPAGLLSSLPWEPERLRGGNYIDAMAMIRRRDLIDLGGYTADPQLTGWEDFDLWCRCATTGRQGLLVPSVLAWYRGGHASMLADTESSITAAWSIMCSRFPELLAPEGSDASPPETAASAVARRPA